MSDFLTRLAARAIAQPTLRPRAVSRFEAAPLAQDAVLSPDTSGRRVSESSTRREEPREARVPTSRRFDDSETRRLSPPPPPAEQTPAPPIRVERALAQEADRQIERVVETQERVLHVPVRETVVEQAPPLPHRFDEQPPRVITEQSIIRERELRERERTIRTSIERAPARSTARETPQAARQSEPVVHVSIGRVEVRAVSPPPQQRSPRRAPAMTIDDYVARRKAKERR
jgi:hypothetical protein